MELGTIAEISFKDSCKMDKAVLYFNIKNSFIDNELGTYSENNDELSGIKRLGIFTFNEEYNIIMPVVTEYDTENNTVYAEVEAQGTYFLVDYEKWLDEWGISAGLDTMAVRFVSAAASVNSADVSNEKIEKADIVFSVDVSAYSRNNLGETPAQNLERAKNDIRTVAENIFAKGEDIRFGVFGFTWKYSSNEIGYRTYLEDGSDWATDLDELDYLLDQLYIDSNYGGAYIECGIQDAASPIITRVKQYEYRDDADKYLFEYAPLSDLYIYSDGYLAATLCSYSALYDQLKRSGIRFSFVLDKLSYLVITETAAMQTGGQTAFYCLDTVTDDISDFIYETANKVKNAVEEDDNDEVKSRTYVSSLNLQNITLDETLTVSGNANTDTDGFTDWEEVDSDNDLITYELGDVHLPTYETCLKACDGTYLDFDKIMNIMEDKLGIVIETRLFGKEILPLTSDPTCEDTDGDGWNDDVDKRPLNNDLTIFGTDEYINDVRTKASEISKRYSYDPIELDDKLLETLKSYGFTPDANERRTAQLAISIMMNDINTCNIDDNVKFSDNWTNFCKYFNENVKTYGYVSEKLHYFRLKLNRAPATLDEMINDINSHVRPENKWIMCSPYKARFHMFGETGAYNIKFISSNATDNMFEAVYDINGNLITEYDDYGKNIGTFNYASSFMEKDLHTAFDVNTYEDWGNTVNDPAPVKKSWDENVTHGMFEKPTVMSDPAIKNSSIVKTIDGAATEYYMNKCKTLFISYSWLKENSFSMEK